MGAGRDGVTDLTLSQGDRGRNLSLSFSGASMNDTITAVPGVRVGLATDPEGRTGVTVLRFPAGTRGGVWVPGSAPGSREWTALSPDHVAGEVHALCLAGGSAFGLAAADGVMAALEEEGEGFDTGLGRVPIVPAAVIFDLHTATARPDRAMGRAAARSASTAPVAHGPIGAGAGALVGTGGGAPEPGGQGSTVEACGLYRIGALAVVNAVGAVVDPTTGEEIAGSVSGEGALLQAGAWRGQTTLVAVATDAPLDRAGCQILAKMASAGLARVLRPAFTPFDGDAVFAFSTRRGALVDSTVLAGVGHAAALAVQASVLRAVQRP